MTPDVSILLVGYQNYDLMADCLRTVYEHTRGVSFEVIVADNASHDAARERITARFPSVVWHDMGHNAGFARANNAAMRHATGRYLLLLNVDTLLTDDVISRMVGYLDAHPDVAAGGATQLDAAGAPRAFDSSFAVRKWNYVVPLRLQPYLDRLFPETRYADPTQVDWLVGAFLMVRREAVERAGPMDESFFMYGEDIEWCSRLGRVGKLVYVPGCTFIHLENPTEFRRTAVSYVNRFGTQMQVSNLLWIRKQFGVGAYLSLILNYAALVPIFSGWKVLSNVLRGRPPLADFDNQRLFAAKTGVLLKFFGQTLFNRPGFYKIAPEDNIDARARAASPRP
jgi:GT2 family glycosyltransferase